MFAPQITPLLGHLPRPRYEVADIFLNMVRPTARRTAYLFTITK